MTKTEIIKILKDDLTPKFKIVRDNKINYLLKKSQKYRELKIELKNTSQKIENFKENPKWRELYNKLYGYYDRKINKQIQGSFFNGLNQKHQKMILKSNEEIKEYYEKEYTKSLNNLLNNIYEEIKKYNQKNIEIGNSEHSYTINTIIASGNVQIIHNRTLRKLHKGIV